VKQLLIIILGFVVAIWWAVIIKDTNDINDRTNNLIQERGENFHKAGSPPDSVYYVTFGGDSVWYIKKEEL